MKENAEIYILSKLEELRRAIPTLKILYKKDSFTREYLVKVIPSEEVGTSEVYQEFESGIILDFITKFPFDSIVFMTEDEWIDVRDPGQVFIGDEYVEETTPTFAANEYFIFQQEDEDFLNLSGILSDYSSEFRKHFNRLASYSPTYAPYDEWLKLGSFTGCTEPGDLYGVISNRALVEDQSTEENDSDCDNYALAA